MDNDYYNIGDETFALPTDFTFRPACGKANQDGSVTVSGYNFTQQEIQSVGREWRELVGILKEIKSDVDDSDGYVKAQTF